MLAWVQHITHMDFFLIAYDKFQNVIILSNSSCALFDFQWKGIIRASPFWYNVKEKEYRTICRNAILAVGSVLCLNLFLVPFLGSISLVLQEKRSMIMLQNGNLLKFFFFCYYCALGSDHFINLCLSRVSNKNQRQGRFSLLSIYHV